MLVSAFQEICQSQYKSFSFPQLWQAQVPLKVSFSMLWLLFEPDSFGRWIGQVVDSWALKIFCCESPKFETINHVFALGELGRAAWNHFGTACGILQGTTDLQNRLSNKWYVSCKYPQVKFLFCIVPIFICWNIWKARNKAFFMVTIWRLDLFVS